MSKKELEAKIASLEADLTREMFRAKDAEEHANKAWTTVGDLRRESRRLQHAQSASDAIRAALIDGGMTLESVTTDRYDAAPSDPTTYSLVIEFRSTKPETLEAVAKKVARPKSFGETSLTFNVGSPITSATITSPFTFRYSR